MIHTINNRFVWKNVFIIDKRLPDLYLVDKLILFCFVNGIDPVLCVNKIEDKKIKARRIS